MPFIRLFKVKWLYGLLATLIFTSNYANPIELTIKGNKVVAVIELANEVTADLTLTFENSVGLTADNIGISASLIDITDLSIINRLADPLNNQLLSAFPMMISVKPDPNKGFSFSGLASVDIHTHNLEFTAGTPLRFFKASDGGLFHDITMTMGAGSYRARGTTGKFSDFIIVADLRSPTSVVDLKYQQLNDRIQTAQAMISSQAFEQLSTVVSQVKYAIDEVKYKEASSLLNEFNRLIEQLRGEQIPDVWRSSKDVENIAGELMAYANTLRFSLRLAQ